MAKKRTWHRKPEPKVEAPESAVTPAPEEEPLPFEPVFAGDVVEERGGEPEAVAPVDGTLIQQDGYPKVFVMQGGKRRHIVDPQAFADCNFAWVDVVILPYEEVHPIPVGKEVTSAKDL